MDCIFCKYKTTVRKQHIVYDIGDFSAFLSKKVISPGHVLVIPKKHYERIWDVENIRGLFLTAEKLALAITKVMQTDNVNIQISYGAIRTRLPHIHIHIIPVYQKNLGPIKPIYRMTSLQMDEIAKRIRNELEA